MTKPFPLLCCKYSSGVQLNRVKWSSKDKAKASFMKSEPSHLWKKSASYFKKKPSASRKKPSNFQWSCLTCMYKMFQTTHPGYKLYTISLPNHYLAFLLAPSHSLPPHPITDLSTKIYIRTWQQSHDGVEVLHVLPNGLSECCLPLGLQASKGHLQRSEFKGQNSLTVAFRKDSRKKTAACALALHTNIGIMWGAFQPHPVYEAS